MMAYRLLLLTLVLSVAASAQDVLGGPLLGPAPPPEAFAKSVRVSPVTCPSLALKTFSIHVFFYQRLQPSRELLLNLTAADYCSYSGRVNLTMHVDWSETPQFGDLAALAEGWLWPHGEKTVIVHSSRVGLRDTWLSAFPAPAEDDLVFGVEDDMEISPLYFQWLLKVLEVYWSPSASERNPSLLGLSLSSITLDEITHPFRIWRSCEHISLDDIVFFSALPSSWGPIYFGDKWAAFLEFVSLRSAPPFYDMVREDSHVKGEKMGDHNLHIPRSRSNTWVRSWKRFMVDFSYANGYLTLYPNLPECAALATTRHLKGEHVAHTPKSEPRHTLLVTDVNLLNRTFPREPVVIDLHCQPATQQGLLDAGDAFLSRIRAFDDSYKLLVDAWGRPGSNVSHAAPSERFLVYSPQMGVSNQLISLSKAMFLAQMSKRTLALPHIFAPRAGVAVRAPVEEWVEYSELFDADALLAKKSASRIFHVSSGNMRGLKPDRVYALPSRPTYDSFQDTYLQSLNWGQLPVQEIDANQKGGLYGAVQRILMSRERVVAFQDVYFMPERQVRTADYYKLMRTPSARTAEAIDLVKNHILGLVAAGHSKYYDCIHLRLTDFVHSSNGPSVCADVALYQAGIPVNSSFFDRSGMVKTKSHCLVTQSMIEAAVNQSKQNVLVVISDDPKMVLDNQPADKRIVYGAELRDLLKTFMSGRSKGYSDLLSIVVEQQVCSQASTAWLNANSTFSKSIQLLRGHSKGIRRWR